MFFFYLKKTDSLLVIHTTLKRQGQYGSAIK